MTARIARLAQGRGTRPARRRVAGLGVAAGSAGDLSQEEILDLFVAATMAAAAPPPADADLEDGDGWDPRDLPGGPADAAAPPPGWGFEADGALDVETVSRPDAR